MQGQGAHSRHADAPFYCYTCCIGKRNQHHNSADALSEREIQVLREVAAGSSNKIVADKLFISEDTVKGHMKSILAKLQANDRTHAVMIATKRGNLNHSALQRFDQSRCGS